MRTQKNVKKNTPKHTNY